MKRDRGRRRKEMIKDNPRYFSSEGYRIIFLVFQERIMYHTCDDSAGSIQGDPTGLSLLHSVRSLSFACYIHHLRKDLTGLDIKGYWPDWEIAGKLGEGSFGAVYLIERNVFDHKEKAALKVITIPQSGNDIEDLKNDGYDEQSITTRYEKYLQDIVREYSLMADLKGCSNIVYCEDVKYSRHADRIGWDVFIKMELLTALPKALSKTITDAQVIKVASDICNALAFCEKRNLVHRDIKPQNILVSSDGTCKLGDFGIAKTVERTTSGTKTGTYKYMAPEVYNNKPYGEKADIYSLGLVLYWMLNERRTPFLPLPPETPTSSEEDAARARRFAGEPIPAPAHGSPELQRIVLKACSFDPDERYQNAEEMLEDLKVLAGNTAAVFPNAVVPDETGPADDRTATSAGELTTGQTSPDEKTLGVFGSHHETEKKKRKWIIPLLAFLLAAAGLIIWLLASPGITELAFSEDVITLTPGDEMQLPLQILPEKASGNKLKWESSDPDIVSVQDGLVQANKTGTATIDVSTPNGKIHADCRLTVVQPIKEIRTSVTELHIVPGNTARIDVEILPDNATDKKLVWTSSDPETVSVSGTGLLTANKPGTVEITIASSDGNTSVKCSVISEIPVEGLSIPEGKLQLSPGDTYTLQVEFYPEDATDREVVWSSSDPETVTVSEDGVLNVLKAGTATITASTPDGRFTAECFVNSIRAITGLKLKDKDLYLSLKDTRTLEVEITPSDATSKDVVWTSSDPEVVSVSDKGVLTVKKAGEATITVATPDGKVSASCKVHTGIWVTGVTLDKASRTIYYGTSVKIKATVKPKDATIQSLSWESSDPSVVTVDSTGKITGVAPGKATITVKTVDGGFTASCEVKVVYQAANTPTPEPEGH